MANPNRSESKPVKHTPVTVNLGISRRTADLTEAAIEAATGVPREQQVGYVAPSEPQSKGTSRG